MKECTKAMRRRWKEDEAGIFAWKKILVGVRGLDVGASDDGVPNFQVFDSQFGHGDANTLSKYFEPEAFAVIHASQCAEHLKNPKEAMLDWLTLIKPGGHLVITVPLMELYGDILWNSGKRFNYDHRATFSYGLRKSGAPVHYYIPDFTAEIEKRGNCTCTLSRIVDTNYDYSVMFMRDQTFKESDAVEAFAEMVWKKNGADNGIS